MGKGKIDKADISDMTNSVTAYTSSSASSTTEVEWQGSWDRWHGIYKDVSLLAALIDAKAMWTVGKGFKVKNDESKKRLEKIRGNGKDTFNIILHNAVKVYTIGGDFFAEIMQTKKGELINLKPLNPAMIKIMASNKGIITGYEQWDSYSKVHRWNPDQIFHLAWNRIADSIHGQSTVERLEVSAQAYKEAKADMRIVFHRYVKPLIISHVDTDDENEIAAYKAKLDRAVELGENLVIPFDTLKLMEKMSIPQYSSLDPLPWIAAIERDFLIAEGVPAVIVGSGEARDTEAEAKILYLAFQQLIEWNQLFIEEQLKAQLGIEIQLEFPASLEPTMQKDESKSRSMNNMESGIGEASGGKK